MANRSGLQANRYVEREVVQRILNSSLCRRAVCGSVIISLMSVLDLAVTTPQSHRFLAAELALVCVFTMRAAGLYDVNALTQGLWTALRASACCLVVRRHIVCADASVPAADGLWLDVSVDDAAAGLFRAHARRHFAVGRTRARPRAASGSASPSWAAARRPSKPSRCSKARAVSMSRSSAMFRRPRRRAEPAIGLESTRRSAASTTSRTMRGLSAWTSSSWPFPCQPNIGCSTSSGGCGSFPWTSASADTPRT